MSIFVSGALVLTKEHFTTIGKRCKIIHFEELFIGLAREHYFWRLLGAPGGSWDPLAARRFMAAPGGSWQLTDLKSLFPERK